MNDCSVIYIEKNIFKIIDNKWIIKQFKDLFKIVKNKKKHKTISKYENTFKVTNQIIFGMKRKLFIYRYYRILNGGVQQLI